MNWKILSFLLLFFSSCYAQDGNIDSLTKVLQKVKKEDQKMDILLELSELVDYNENLSYKKEALALSEREGVTARTEQIAFDIANMLHDSYQYEENLEFCLLYFKKFKKANLGFGRVNMAFHLGVSYKMIGKEDSMFYYCADGILNANENNEREKQLKSQILRNRGYEYLRQSKYIKAIQDLEYALKLLGEKNYSNKTAVRMVLFNIYFDLDDREKAFAELELAAKAAKNARYEMLANTYYYYALYFLKENPQKSLEYALKGLRMYEDHKHAYGVLFMKNVLAEIYFELGDFDQAEKTNLFIAERASELHAEENGAVAMINLGHIALERKNFPLALNYCEQGWLFFEKGSSFPEKKKVCECLYKAHKALRNNKEALVFHEKMVTFDDSLRNENAVREIYRTQKNIEVEKQKNAFKTAELEKELETSKKIKGQQWVIGGIAILAFIILFILLLYYRSSQAKKKAAELVLKEKRYLDNLLHNMVHEFRTPLTLIKGPTEELLKVDEHNELLQMVNKNGDRLLSLVNQVLDYAKIKSGKWKVVNEMTHFDSFIADTIELFHPLAKQKDILIVNNSGINSTLNVDNDKLFKIISNLLSNAIKYSNGGTEIMVSSKLKGTQLIMVVRDQGIGIDPKDQKKVFTKFYQVDSSLTRKSEGTGIGLAFTQELVHLMGGSIALTSGLKKGTEITVSLPVEVLSVYDTPTNKPIVSSPILKTNILEDEVDEEEMKSILVIEDNYDLRSFLTHLLTKENYNVILASNGEEGVIKAIEMIPDLIISDVMMPKKDGYQVVQELKTNPVTEHIPIVILTAKASFDSMIIGLDNGADDYLSKPFKSKELLLRIGNQMERQEKMRLRYQGQSNGSEVEIVKHPFIVEIERRVAEDFTIQFSVEELAEKCALSRSQLHRKVKSITGLSASGLLTKIRMERAFHDLKTSDLNISEVSYNYGYSDPANFSRVFKKQFGKTPSEIRDSAI